MPTPRVRLLVLGVLALFVLPLPAEASIKIAGDARNPTLRVNASGTATITWRTGSGARRSAIVRPGGRLYYGRTASGRDVSSATTAVSIPMKLVLRQTPDGRFWALQAWRRLKTGPVELRFSRWRDAPTKLVVRTTCCRWRSEVVYGKATFHGRPIYGYRFTPQGAPLDRLGRNVYLDTFRRGSWKRMMGVISHRPTGNFRLWIRPHWQGRYYRGRIVGPNWGRQLAPDAQGRAATRL
jgi:hypothetical protein